MRNSDKLTIGRTHPRFTIWERVITESSWKTIPIFNSRRNNRPFNGVYRNLFRWLRLRRRKIFVIQVRHSGLYFHLQWFMTWLQIMWVGYNHVSGIGTVRQVCFLPGPTGVKSLFFLLVKVPKGKVGCVFPMVNLSEFGMGQYRDEKPSGRSFRPKVRPILTLKSFLRVEQFYLFPLIPSGAVLFIPFEFNRSSSIYSVTH